MEKYYKYLDELRDSGKVNMFQAVPYIMAEFNITKSKAQDILIRWMYSFDQQHTQEEKEE